MHSATLAKPVTIEGRGIFSGEPCRAEIGPAKPGSGLAFISNGTRVPVHPVNAAEQDNCTVLERGTARVAVVEHLLVALWAAGIDTAEITVDGPELPNQDGSALPLYSAVAAAGRFEHGPKPELRVHRAVEVEDGRGDTGGRIELTPSAELSIAYRFDHPELGSQEFSALLTRDFAQREILPARSFVTLNEVHAARAAGHLKNEHEEDALVIRDPLSPPPLRFPNEYARHKVLDLLGDLYLLPYELTGRITAVRSGHALNRELVRRLLRMATG